jgi:hypothetical protein
MAQVTTRNPFEIPVCFGRDRWSCSIPFFFYHCSESGWPYVLNRNVLNFKYLQFWCADTTTTSLNGLTHGHIEVDYRKGVDNGTFTCGQTTNQRDMKKKRKKRTKERHRTALIGNRWWQHRAYNRFLSNFSFIFLSLNNIISVSRNRWSTLAPEKIQEKEEMKKRHTHSRGRN